MSLAQDQLKCPACLDLLKDPVTIPCGHVYCMSCITDCWNQEQQTRIYRCPVCKQTFTPRPVLYKNMMVAELVENLKKTELESTGSAQCYAGPGDVECDVCTGTKLKAVKSCLVCLESYCQSHVERHEEFHSGRHKMTDATGRLKDMICSQHNRQRDVFCRTDQKCICLLCTMDYHKNHDTVSAAAERTEKQKLLGKTQETFQQRIQEREKELQKLREAVNSYKCSAQTAVRDIERIFTEMICSIERRRSEVTQLIRDQEKAAVSRAEGLVQRLEQDITELKKRDTQLKQLSHTDDHIYFLQSFQSLSVPPESTGSFIVSSLLSFDDVKQSLSLLKEKLEQFCREEIEIISSTVRYIITPPELKAREEFLQYFHQFSLDPNTAHTCIHLSERDKMATKINTHQQYPDHPDRFDYWPQVLCRESVCGRCYCEVEWRGWVYISVSYKSISRKGGGDESSFGNNDQSWSFYYYSSSYSLRHNNIVTNLPVLSRSSRIGVYVDHSAGTLSFYSISDKMTLIHSVQTTFTQPLYLGFWLGTGSSVKLCDLTK